MGKHNISGVLPDHEQTDDDHLNKFRDVVKLVSTGLTEYTRKLYRI